MFSEIAEIARVAARLGQFLQFLKTRVILILNFTRPHAITHTITKMIIYNWATYIGIKETVHIAKKKNYNSLLLKID